MRGNDLLDTPSQCFKALPSGESFQRAVPSDNPSLNILYDDTDADGFNNVFAEVLQAFVFERLMFERPVKPRIFQSDSDVVRYRVQQLAVFARQIIAVLGSAETDITDHMIFDAARDEIIQIVQVRLKEVIRTARRRGQERKVGIRRKRESRGADRRKLRIVRGILQKNHRAGYKKRPAKAIDNPVEHPVEIHFRTQRPAEIDQRLTQV